jgi:hypothetical protein
MRILCNILVVLFVTATAVGQQINPVPDYIFRNSMSVGRNAPTDTSAYFSIGPRFGATRGFMPPMVIDTAAVTGTKRNGLLIYSIQRNSFLYWDSTGSRWSRIAANLDTLLLSTRAWRQKGDDSLAAIINTRTDTVNLLSTKAWRQKGIDSLASVRIGGSGVTGYIPKFTAARTLDSSQIIQSGGRIGIGTVSAPITKVQIEAGGGRVLWVLDSAIHQTSANTNITVENHFQNLNGVASIDLRTARFGTDGTFGLSRVGGVRTGNGTSDLAFSTSASADNPTERMRITSSGESLFGTTSDAGDFRVQVSGNQYVSGNVGVGTTSPSFKLDVDGIIRGNYITSTTEYRINNASFTRIAKVDGTGGGFAGGYNADIATGVVSHAETGAINAFHYAGNLVGIRFFSDSSRAAGTTATARMIILPNGNVGIGTTSPSERLHVNGNILGTGNITTADPSGGTKKPWRLGEAATVSPTSPNRTIRVEIDGVVYYLHAKTTND